MTFLPLNDADVMILAAEGQVLFNCQMMDDIKVLINDPDTQSVRFRQGFDLNRLSLPVDLPLIFLKSTCDDFYQGGFSRPIFSQQGMNFPWNYFKFCIIQCLHAAKTFIEIFYFQQRFLTGFNRHSELLVEIEKMID